MTVLEPARARTTSDAGAVIALDIEYQTAVERADVTTMDRILADDFVLMAGACKRFSHVAVAVAIPLGLREPDSVDDARVTQLVADDGVTLIE